MGIRSWMLGRRVRRIEREIEQRKQAEARTEREAAARTAALRGEAKRCQSVVRDYYIGKFALDEGEERVLKAARSSRGVKVREGENLNAAKRLVAKKLLKSAGKKGLLHVFRLTEGGKCYRTVRRLKRNLPICLPLKCNGKSKEESGRTSESYRYTSPPSPYEHGSRHYEV